MTLERHPAADLFFERKSAPPQSEAARFVSDCSIQRDQA